MINNSDTNKPNFGEFIYNMVQEFYNLYILQPSKPQKNQWTVISALILENNNKYKIICFANGTKSLPNINYKSRKFQIFDCHAEILTLRCFKFFLINALSFYLDKSNEKNSLNKNEFDLFNSNKDFYDIFEFNETNKKFVIKRGVKFHLYISELPCGECSNIEFNNNNQENIKEMTGSKTLEECLNIIDKNKKIKKEEENINKYNYYKFRTKSIRSDFKINNLSYSLSCTDKIILRNILGYQGKFLSFLIEPIFLNSIIINTSLVNNQENINKFKNCIDYIFRKNIKNDNINYNIPEIYFVFHKENSDFNDGKKKDKNSLPFSVYWYFPNNIKKVDPSNGIKTGGNIKEDDKIDLLRVKISNYDLCEMLINILLMNSKDKKVFSRSIKKLEEYILKNGKNIDFYDLMFPLLDEKYNNIKNSILEDNHDLKNFIGRKRKILKKD